MTVEAAATEGWRAELRAARKRLGLSQAQMAARAGVSTELVRAYENGRRDATRKHLVDLIEAMQMDRAWRNKMLLDAGFAPDGMIQRPADIQDWWLTPDEAEREIATYPWPSFVLGERGEVMSANFAAQALWSVDMEREYLEPFERNLLSIASNPHFADRCLNWEEAVGFIVRMFKSFHRHPEDLADPTPYMKAVLEHFMAGDPKYVGRFTTLWQAESDAEQTKFRFTYPIVWAQPGVGTMRFKCLFSTANEIDGFNIHDWIPVDAESWVLLERIKAEAAAQRASAK